MVEQRDSHGCLSCVPADDVVWGESSMGQGGAHSSSASSTFGSSPSSSPSASAASSPGSASSPSSARSVSSAASLTSLAFAPGTEEIRRRVADDIVLGVPEIVDTVERVTGGRDQRPEDAAAWSAIDDAIRVNSAKATRLVARWVATGTLPTLPELDQLAEVGRRVAQNMEPFSRVVRANLAWRDAVANVIEDAGQRHGGDPSVMLALRSGVEMSCSANLMRTAQQFDEESRVLESALAERQRALAYQALHDPLTGLANRTLLFERLGRLSVSNRSRPAQGVPAIVFVDLDGFKEINDTQGHGVGDSVLVTLGQRLTSAVAPDDVVARLGGDEFVVLCESVSGPEQALDLAHRIVDVLRRPVPCGAVVVEVGASAGVAVAEPGQLDMDRLLSQADHAMYRAKQRGRGQVVVAE